MLLENINKSFGGNQILKDFSIDFPDRKITCILGNSGCGKTTLLSEIASLKKSVSFLFQEPRLLPWLTVLENVSVALHDDEESAKKYLKIVGLSDSLDKFPSELSGGMKQRVAIARAFASKADIILMDEPFQSLDIALRESLRKQFIELWKESKSTVIWVTHDIAEACMSADRIYCVGSRPMQIKKSFDMKNPQSEANIDLIAEILKVMSPNQPFNIDN